LTDRTGSGSTVRRLPGGAVHGFREDPGGGGFTDSAGTDKQICMGGTLLLDGVFQGLDNMFLADDIKRNAAAAIFWLLPDIHP